MHYNQDSDYFLILVSLSRSGEGVKLGEIERVRTRLAGVINVVR